MNAEVPFGDRSLIHLFQKVSHYGDEPWQTPARERDLIAFADMILMSRRLRESMFDPDLFSDPAWDLLLDILVGGRDGKPVRVSSLGIAAGIRPTTALRYIALLERYGLVVPHEGEGDRKRPSIALSEKGRNSILSLLDQMEALSISTRNVSSVIDR